MKTVVVVMSTYNGETYLREQIDSILNQEGVKVVLLVRDDGSTDKTVDILREYEKKEQLAILSGENLGVGNSFMELLYQAPQGDYYAFADQDDIWLPKKLITAVQMLDTKKIPCVYASNQIVSDALGNEKGYRFQNQPPVSLFQIIDRSQLSGCTMVMNRQLYDLLVEEKRRPAKQLLKKRIHDVWVLAAGATCGEIIYDSKSYILYRQHGNNVVGVEKVSIKKRLKMYLKVFTGKANGNIRSWTAGEIGRCFEDVAVKEAKEVLTLYKNLKSVKGKRAFCNSRFVKDVVGNPLIFKIKVWFGLV